MSHNYYSENTHVILQFSKDILFKAIYPWSLLGKYAAFQHYVKVSVCFETVQMRKKNETLIEVFKSDHCMLVFYMTLAPYFIFDIIEYNILISYWKH